MVWRSFFLHKIIAPCLDFHEGWCASGLFTVIFYIVLRDFSEVNRLEAERAREAWNAMNYRIMLLMKMEWQQKTALAAVLVNKFCETTKKRNSKRKSQECQKNNTDKAVSGLCGEIWRIQNDKRHYYNGHYHLGLWSSVLQMFCISKIIVWFDGDIPP